LAAFATLDVLPAMGIGSLVKPLDAAGLPVGRGAGLALGLLALAIALPTPSGDPTRWTRGAVMAGVARPFVAAAGVAILLAVAWAAVDPLESVLFAAAIGGLLAGAVLQRRKPQRRARWMARLLPLAALALLALVALAARPILQQRGIEHVDLGLFGAGVLLAGAYLARAAADARAGAPAEAARSPAKRHAARATPLPEAREAAMRGAIEAFVERGDATAYEAALLDAAEAMGLGERDRDALRAQLEPWKQPRPAPRRGRSRAAHDAREREARLQAHRALAARVIPRDEPWRNPA
jgi:hypothetical protein